MSDDLKVHTLTDFNLREDGTQLVPNEGACDLRGCSEGVRREVEKLVSEALPTKELSDQQRAANAGFYVWNPKYMFVETEGWDGEDDLLTPSDLGIHEPDQSEASGKTSAIKVGARALDSKNRTCTILAIAQGYALCRYANTPEQKHPVRAVELRKLRPASYTVDLSESLMAIVEPKGVTIEGITFSLDALNKLVDAADDLIDLKTAKS